MEFKDYLIATLFVIVGIVLLVLAVMEYKRIKSSSLWKNTQGKIVTCKIIRRRPHRRAAQYETLVEYEYDINQKTYFNDKVTLAFGKYLHRSSASAENAIKNYNKGDAVEVWYNPDDLNQSCLDKSVDYKSLLIYVVGSILLFVFAYMGLTQK